MVLGPRPKWASIWLRSSPGFHRDRSGLRGSSEREDAP